MGKSSPYNYKHVYACNISQFCPVGFRLIDNAMIHSCGVLATVGCVMVAYSQN